MSYSLGRMHTLDTVILRIPSMKAVKKLFFGYKDVLDFKDVLMKVVKSLIECTPCIHGCYGFQ